MTFSYMSNKGHEDRSSGSRSITYMTHPSHLLPTAEIYTVYTSLSYVVFFLSVTTKGL